MSSSRPQRRWSTGAGSAGANPAKQTGGALATSSINGTPTGRAVTLATETQILFQVLDGYRKYTNSSYNYRN